MGVACWAVLLLSPALLAAKDGDHRDRQRFYGWVEVRPEALQGTWVIGGREVTTSPQTQFDETDGPLKIGACAKVDLRGGVVHEIDSEPDRDCR
jgi:hypothetical protein